MFGRWTRFLGVGLLLGLCACDWHHFALMNSLPVRGERGNHETVYVYLGVDGLAHSVVLEAMERGAFREQEWELAPMVSMFPGTSDASWSRILRTKGMQGYEYEYYDPRQDTIVNKGYMGLIKHAVPPFESMSLDPPEYLKAFDYYANGYLDTVWKYDATDRSYGETLDNLFYLLAGHMETTQVFSGYVMELDVMGHMQTRERAVEALLELDKRIRKFKRRHQDHRFVFTLFSDHGMDFIHAKEEELVRFDAEMNRVGVRPVESLAQGRRLGGLYAVPIIHTRVSYLSLHADQALAPKVAQRLSTSPVVDFSISRRPPREELDAGRSWQWFALWRQGSANLEFAYDKATDAYVLPAEGDYAAYDVDIAFAPGQTHQVLTDEELFALTQNRLYPDLFFRVRTSFEPISVQYPGDVLVSFKRPYASRGFEIPGGANEIASAGFHGAMDELASLGVLLTSERDLPDAVRSDNFMDYFPRLQEHLRELGVHAGNGEANAPLAY